jgi:hypothetical protein
MRVSTSAPLSAMASHRQVDTERVQRPQDCASSPDFWAESGVSPCVQGAGRVLDYLVRSDLPGTGSESNRADSSIATAPVVVSAELLVAGARPDLLNGGLLVKPACRGQGDANAPTESVRCDLPGVDGIFRAPHSMRLSSPLCSAPRNASVSFVRRAVFAVVLREYCLPSPALKMRLALP